ncbi:mediator of replication checkpoint protein 1 [Achaetomium macrosporum]|uniref:Mediator of replication checkpoint protein 1 n=1 Tax=Achaetomium macrosporum TaxID=79813 RepID=A0AAN7C9H2_9PEZI|nr:mediator of replication checkpoint protein 1 [Achaetomium macrosporum]
MAPSRSPSPALRGSRSATRTTTRPTAGNPFAALSDSSSEEDDDILRPRGKIASRMQVRGSTQQTSDSEADDDANQTRASSPRKKSNDAQSTGDHDDADDSDDDDVVRTRPRNLKPRRDRSSTPEAPASPGLFVTPSKSHSPSAENSQSDDDLPSPATLTKNPRFHALVAKKRQERLAREAEEARKKAERMRAAGHNLDDILADDDEDNITDDDGDRKLTQEAAAARPPRKASKKALEEMNRETQRLTRSLQLAHEAKVKKKITKATLFERFNFKPEGAAAPAEETAPAATSSSRAPTPGSAQQSDAEMKDAETPPSSPPQISKDGRAEGVVAAVADTAPAADDDDLPTMEEMVEEAAAARKRLDKGKGKATAADLDEARPKAEQQPRKRNIRVKLPPLEANTATLSLDDEDDDLRIQQPTRKSKLDAIFDRVPLNQAKEPHSLQMLRKLAHLDDPDRKAAPPSRRGGSKLQSKHEQQHAMTAAELQVNLLQRARQQAKLERDRQLEMLRAKGIHVQTAEEREKELQEVENIVEKARKEAEEIMERERQAAKAERKKRREAGEEDLLGWDDSDEEDEEYVEDEKVEAEAEIELSGSEEEEEEADEDGEDEADPAGLMIDDAAESAEESETEKVEEQEKLGGQDSDEEFLSSKQVRRRPRKQVTILSDDEDEAAEPLAKATPRPKAHFSESPSRRTAKSPSVPTSVLRSATKTFIPGLPVAGPAGLGLTQIFAGTMDDSQVGTAAADSPSQPRPTFDVAAFPDSNFSQTAQEAAEDMILDSQPTRETQQAETQGVQIHFSQSQTHGFDSFLRDTQNPTQASELIEPTQDAGFHNFSPLRQRFVEAPVSTVETVPVGHSQADEDQNESPLVRRTGKLRRKADVVAASPSRHRRTPDDQDEVMEDELATDEFGFGTRSNNAFTAMKEAALKKKRKEAFDKKKSKAREMVEEQAEESEDEYAGLGGVDGEDSDDDVDDQSVKEMIDDETKNDENDERKLAAFYADRERAADEKQVEKLFHDVTTGMLRRKRNGNWDDLSDSDDGGEARRRLKRRQFAKMQRALFADERISKVAENPRNQAFLRTIEDRGSDDEMDFIFAPPPAAPGLDSQESQASVARKIIPNSQPQTAASRPLANPRRTKEGSKKPSSIAEIRESLSNLLEEPSSVIPATEPDSSDDDHEEQDPRPPSSSNKENENRHHPRRSKPTPSIIDRITLKRNSSSSAVSANSRLAFSTTTTTTSTMGGVPPLLRRATTNNSLLSTSTASSTSISTSSTMSMSKRQGGGGGGDDMKIKKTAGKRSGVSYLARETERRAALAEAERRREARKWKGVEGRAKAVGGLFGRGTFE